MEILSKLFGSTNRVKILRLFLFNASTPFDIPEVASRSNVDRTIARSEINMLLAIGFLTPKDFVRETSNARGTKEQQISGVVLNKSFTYVVPLHKMLVEWPLIEEEDILQRFKNAGKLKMVVISGIFIKEDDNPIDLLIVGDNLKKNFIENAISKLESDIGKELKYAIFENDEFDYRFKMYDKLLRDIFDNKHKVILNSFPKDTVDRH